MRKRLAFTLIELLIVTAAMVLVSMLAVEAHWQHGTRCRRAFAARERRREESARYLHRFDHGGRAPSSIAGLHGSYLLPASPVHGKEDPR